MYFFHSKGCLVWFGYFNSKETNARYLKSYINILDSQEMNAKHYEKNTGQNVMKIQRKQKNSYSKNKISCIWIDIQFI